MSPMILQQLIAESDSERTENFGTLELEKDVAIAGQSHYNDRVRLLETHLETVFTFLNQHPVTPIPVFLTLRNLIVETPEN